MFKIKRLLFTPLFLSLISSSLHADELPERLYGSWQFTGTAGEAVIGELTITKEYVAYGSALNGVCSDSYKVKRLPDDNDYPDNLIEDTRGYISYRTYRLLLDNPRNCVHGDDTLQISFQQNPISSINNSYPKVPKYINEINLVTYKDGELSGWFSGGFKLTEYIRKPWSWGTL